MDLSVSCEMGTGRHWKIPTDAITNQQRLRYHSLVPADSTLQVAASADPVQEIDFFISDPALSVLILCITKTIAPIP